MGCRLVDSGFGDAFTNMAIDEGLAQLCKEPILRFYQWSPKAVSLGYNQKISDININYCKKNDIDIVRRITGGKAVLHDKELTYSFIVPEKLNLVPRDINESFKKIAGVLIFGLSQVGINAELQKKPERISTPVCFNSSNWYELTVEGKKISGSAQRRIKGILLQHGSILLDFDTKENVKIFTTQDSKATETQFNDKITSIKSQLQKPVSINSLKKGIEEGFSGQFEFKIYKSKLTTQETILASTIKEYKICESKIMVKENDKERTNAEFL